MRPPFPYYGGKTRLARHIVALLPEHRHYVEPFAGSLSVLLAKQPSRIETVNDLDGELMNFWRVLRDRIADLERACALTPYARAEHQAAYEPTSDEVERARRLWVLLSQGRTARAVRTGWRESPPSTSLTTTLRGYVGRFADLAERLQRVELECRPALDLVKKYGDSADACLYVDPPYLAETRTGTGYRHEMASTAEHRELLDALRSCSAAVVLSGYDSPLYADALGDWSSTRLSAVTAQGRNGAQRVEVLWSNRPLPAGVGGGDLGLRPEGPVLGGEGLGGGHALDVGAVSHHVAVDRVAHEDLQGLADPLGIHGEIVARRLRATEEGAA